LGIVEGGYQYPIAVPTDPAENKIYENNAKAINSLLGSLSESEFIEVMQFNTDEAICDKIIHNYEGYSQVKCAKLQTLKIPYETVKMHSDETISSYFL